MKPALLAVLYALIVVGVLALLGVDPTLPGEFVAVWFAYFFGWKAGERRV